MSSPSLAQLRSYAVSRTLFKPATLAAAVDRLGFVQADPIRSPARAQDLTLRHRVRAYRAGDLDRQYERLGLEEDFFVNYGFLRPEHRALMHPRSPRQAWSVAQAEQAQAVWRFVRERGVVHPRDVHAQFKLGLTRNWFGGTSNASTQLLDAMHYRGLLRVARRDGGTRVYAATQPLPAPQGSGEVHARLDALIDLVVHKYAPLPSASLSQLVAYLRGGAPQWSALYGAALERARQRLAGAWVDGVHWYWPAAERCAARRWQSPDDVRLLTPFDPLVWDRRRFEMLWGWAYRFEAYTPAHRRQLGYYALPLLWRDQVIGWGNVAVVDGALRAQIGYVSGRAPREAGFRAALQAELERLECFLGLSPTA